MTEQRARETVARIIDPGAWRRYDAMMRPFAENRGALEGESWHVLAYQRGCRSVEDAHRWWAETADAQREPVDIALWRDSLVKAGDILSALSTPFAESAKPPSDSEMAAFGASDAACYYYPGEHQQAERVAFCDGAARAAESATPAVDREGLVHMLSELRFGPPGDDRQTLGDVLCDGVQPDPHDDSAAAVYEARQTLIDGILALHPVQQSDGWQDISTAPKDGTEILAWCVHPNAEYAGTIAEKSEWQCPVVTRWIDHNGGGWTWHGMLGRFTHWQPLPTPPAKGVVFNPAGDAAKIAEKWLESAKNSRPAGGALGLAERVREAEIADRAYARLEGHFRSLAHIASHTLDCNADDVRKLEDSAEFVARYRKEQRDVHG
jgi:hypothetical protein